MIIAKPASDYGGKPPPAAVVRSADVFDLHSLTVCPFTSVDEAAALLRLRVEPTNALPLGRVLWMMVDEITTIRIGRVGQSVGRSSEADHGSARSGARGLSRNRVMSWG